MSRMRSRFERLRRATAVAYGCPECRPVAIEIVEVIVDSHEAAREGKPVEGPAAPAYCRRCGREKLIQFVEFPISELIEGADTGGA